MNNGLQKIGKVDYDRRFRQKLRDMIVILKDIQRKKHQKKLKYKNNDSLRYKTPLNPVYCGFLHIMNHIGRKFF